MQGVEQILEAIASVEIYGDTAVNVHIALARQQTSLDCFGENYNYAIALRTAHTLTLKLLAEAGANSGAGPIKSKSEGELSLGFGNVSGNADMGDLGLTNYGIQLYNLIQNNVSGFTVAAPGAGIACG